MRIMCHSIKDFLDNLAKHTNEIWMSSVWVDRSINAWDESLTSTVTIQTYAVVALADGSQFIIQGGEICGDDYEDGDEEKNGTERADKLTVEIMHYCNEVGLDVRPGTLEE